MTHHVTRALAPALLAATVLLATGGCFLLPASTPSSAPTESSSPTESATPTSTPTPTAEPITCESVLNPDTITTWEGEGVTENLNFVQKLHDEGNTLVAFADNGGIICQWGFANGAATAIYGYSKISEADTITWENHVGDLGATISVHPYGNLYSLDYGENADGPEYYLFSAGGDDPTNIFWLYAWTPDLIDEVLSNIPNP